MTAVDRLMQFIDYKGFAEGKKGKSLIEFYKQNGLPNGSLKGVKSVGSENLKKIALKNEDLNIDWVVTGRGEMLVKEMATNSACSTCLEWERKFNAEVQKNRDLLEEIRALEKSKQLSA